MHPLRPMCTSIARRSRYRSEIHPYSLANQTVIAVVTHLSHTTNSTVALQHPFFNLVSKNVVADDYGFLYSKTRPISGRDQLRLPACKFTLFYSDHATG